MSPDHRDILKAAAAASLLCAGLSCVLGPASSVAPLRLERVDGQGDTLPPFPTLRIAFGEPLEDSVVQLDMTPPFSCAYSAWLNARRDTLTLRVTGMLEGETRYVIRLGAPVTGASGARLLPSEDSVVFYTYARESGQNRTGATADTLDGRLFGMLEVAGDTAYFIAGSVDARTFYVASFDAPVRMAVRDAGGAGVVSAPVNSGDRDTVAAPDTLEGPFSVRVFADPLQSGVRFEVGE